MLLQLVKRWVSVTEEGNLQYHTDWRLRVRPNEEFPPGPRLIAGPAPGYIRVSSSVTIEPTGLVADIRTTDELLAPPDEPITPIIVEG